MHPMLAMAFRTPVAASSPYPLDALSVKPIFAVSLRRLKTAYAGPAIKVRRSSDNATADIGFSSGDLDTVALSAFIGANSGYIDTWYDQIGTAHMTAPSTASQPRIVNAGTIDLKNSKPITTTMGFTSGLTTGTTAIAIGGNKATESTVGFYTATRASRFNLSFIASIDSADYVGGTSAAFGVMINLTTLESQRGSPLSGVALISGALIAGMGMYDGTNNTQYVNNVAGATVANALPFGALGKLNNSDGGACDGGIFEHLFWNHALSSSDRVILFASQQSYYGI